MTLDAHYHLLYHTVYALLHIYDSLRLTHLLTTSEEVTVKAALQKAKEEEIFENFSNIMHDTMASLLYPRES